MEIEGLTQEELAIVDKEGPSGLEPHQPDLLSHKYSAVDGFHRAAALTSLIAGTDPRFTDDFKIPVLPHSVYVLLSLPPALPPHLVLYYRLSL